MRIMLLLRSAYTWSMQWKSRFWKNPSFISLLFFYLFFIISSTWHYCCAVCVRAHCTLCTSLNLSNMKISILFMKFSFVVSLFQHSCFLLSCPRAHCNRRDWMTLGIMQAIFSPSIHNCNNDNLLFSFPFIHSPQND